MVISPFIAALPLLTVSFIVLHRADGGEVAVNPAHVTSLRTPAGRLDPHAPNWAHCMVGLTDAKFVFVIETCRAVQQLLEGATK